MNEAKGVDTGRGTMISSIQVLEERAYSVSEIASLAERVLNAFNNPKGVIVPEPVDEKLDMGKTVDEKGHVPDFIDMINTVSDDLSINIDRTGMVLENLLSKLG